MNSDADGSHKVKNSLNSQVLGSSTYLILLYFEKHKIICNEKHRNQ